MLYGRGFRVNDFVDEDVSINSDGNVLNEANPDLKWVDTDLLSSESDRDVIPNEDVSDVDEELRSFRDERRNKRNPNLRRKKSSLKKYQPNARVTREVTASHTSDSGSDSRQPDDGPSLVPSRSGPFSLRARELATDCQASDSPSW
ncbi:hypothetical protein HAX54_050505 [Datura stramonium]|uniref:Uncharacterized protein n=1 Tax=Datura stramonium TaxID=4076 RepID=A0ABS8SWJ9_DATST|nr:hypothetical protein [Datura stramonium]